MAGIKEKVSNFIKNSEFTPKEQFGYSAGTFGNAMAQDAVETYSEMFIIDDMGIGKNAPSYTLKLKAITKGLNIITAPVVGYLLDRSVPGQNRTLKFMLFSSIPMAISSVLLFTVPPASVSFKILWVFLLYLLFNVVDTFFDISLMTLSTRLSGGEKSRGALFTISQFASTLGSMLPGWIFPLIIGDRKGNIEAEKKAYFMIALIFGFLGLIAMLVPCLSLKEQSFFTVNTKKEKTSINFKLILLNRPLLLLCLSQMIDSVRQVCYNALPYFYKYTLGKFALKPVVEVCSGTLSYLGLASVPFVSKKLSPRSIVSYGYLYTGIVYVLLAIFGYKSQLIVAILIAIGGMPNSAMGAARKMVLADSVDYMEWKTKEKYGTPMRNEGMVFAFNTLCSRISSLWKDLLFTAGLILIGYKGAETVNNVTVEAVQSPETLKGIFWLVVVPGIVGNIIPGLIMLLDNFTGERREAIMAELRALRETALNEADGSEIGGATV